MTIKTSNAKEGMERSQSRGKDLRMIKKQNKQTKNTKKAKPKKNPQKTGEVEKKESL